MSVAAKPETTDMPATNEKNAAPMEHNKLYNVQCMENGILQQDLRIKHKHKYNHYSY